ncbi:hypothetical protein BC628DRAFT_922981 [Trametes gibbosa]|nr:hypothetical protein BC628DRAFT_922981 [Trametes gibbosa]
MHRRPAVVPPAHCDSRQPPRRRAPPAAQTRSRPAPSGPAVLVRLHGPIRRRSKGAAAPAPKQRASALQRAGPPAQARAGRCTVHRAHRVLRSQRWARWGAGPVPRARAGAERGARCALTAAQSRGGRAGLDVRNGPAAQGARRDGAPVPETQRRGTRGGGEPGAVRTYRGTVVGRRGTRAEDLAWRSCRYAIDVELVLVRSGKRWAQCPR